MKLLRASLFLGTAAIVAALGMWGLTWLKMPDHDYALLVPPLRGLDADLVQDLRADTFMLASTIGPRNRAYNPESLEHAAMYIEARLAHAGYDVRREAFQAGDAETRNLVARLPGTLPGVIVIGAHYDSYMSSPGANDNASGVAVLLALARRMRQATPGFALQFVAFANEEPPDYKTIRMGSVTHADGLAARRERVVAMFSLESVGYYTDAARSQTYPFPLDLVLYDKGDFIGVVGNLQSLSLMRRFSTTFRRHSHFPLGGMSLPQWLPGVDWSDQWRFWKRGIAALMITDSAFYRDPYYHTQDDRPERLDYERMAHVVLGLEQTMLELSQQR